MILIQRRRRVTRPLDKPARRYYEYRVIDPDATNYPVTLTEWGLTLDEARKAARTYGRYQLEWRQ